jgi:predicted DNA-binding transcriptional regulator YafY
LGVIAAALQDRQGIHLVRRGPSGTKVSRTGLALGLVIGDGEWYLVWAPRGGQPRADRVDDLIEVEAVSSPVAEPEEFDVGAFWEVWRERETQRNSGLEARLRVAPDLLPLLRRRFESRMEVESDDPPVVRLQFGSIYAARADVLAWGGAAEVLKPEALRRTVADFAAQAAGVYGG